MSEFPSFAKIVAASFQAIAKEPQVFVTNVDGEELYQHYLAAFPIGTNPPLQEADGARVFVLPALHPPSR